MVARTMTWLRSVFASPEEAGLEIPPEPVMKKRWAVIIPEGDKPVIWCDTESKFIEAWLTNQPCGVHWSSKKVPFVMSLEKKYTHDLCINKPIGKNEGPIIVGIDGSIEYYADGECHREDGPAIICFSGDLHYMVRGKRHCESGPAVIRSSGTLEYWRNGLRHHENGPAVVYSDGSCQYWRNGKRLRMDGLWHEEPNGSDGYGGRWRGRYKPLPPSYYEDDL